ncbi:MAG: hypothetical protein LUC31_02825 [Coprobacillus sp.]|nr:hypothetical protein [Coprobacillus sp.]
MGHAQRLFRCHRCGTVLQSENPEQPGYIPASVLSREVLSTHVLYCQKCFDTIEGLNKSELDTSVDEDILRMLDDAVATDAAIIWIVNLFTFSGILSPAVIEKVKHLPVAVVGTKVDLFHSKTDLTAPFSVFLQDRFIEAGITPEYVKVVGKGDNKEAADFINFVNDFRKGRDVYLIGEVGSGKTTLINRCLLAYENNSEWQIKREYYPGTNEMVLEIPLSNSNFLYELPGISRNYSVLAKVEKEVQRMITPKNEVKVTTKTLKPGECLMLGGLAAFALYEGKETSFRVYVSEGVEIKVVPWNKYESIFQKNLHTREVRPVSEKLTDFMDFDLFEYQMEDDWNKHDIAIEGLGWVTFVAMGQTIRVRLPHQAAVKEAKSRLG